MFENKKINTTWNKSFSLYIIRKFQIYIAKLLEFIKSNLCIDTQVNKNYSSRI